VKLPTRPPGFGDDQRPGGDVPGREPGLEEGVVPAGGDVAEVERGGAGAAHAGAALHHRLEDAQVVGEVVALSKRKAGADQRVGHARSLRDAQPLVVEEGAAALRREEEVVPRRVVDDRLLDLVAKGEADRDRVGRQAVDEVGRAVERVDDPDVLAVARAARAARLLGEDAVARDRPRARCR
jgi:hypothetical protein